MHFNVPTSHHSYPPIHRSVGDLRDLVKAAVTRKESSASLKSQFATSLIYMEHFFYAIFCLTEVKRVFDEIYADLYYSYYSTEDVTRQVFSCIC